MMHTMAMSGVVLAAAAACFAGEATPERGRWSAGVETGYVESTFRPRYTYTTPGSTPDQYADVARGLRAGLIASGRVASLGEGFSVSVQARVAIDAARWSLEIPEEPASLEMDIPWAHAVSLVPELALSPRVGVYVEAGVGQGYIRQKKDSPGSTRYDQARWTWSSVLGGGARLGLAARLQLFLSYRRTAYRSYGFDSHLPDGTTTEHIEDQPRSSAWTIGLRRTF